VPGETRRRSRGRGGGRLSGMISGGGGMWFRIMGRGVGLSTVMRNWTRGGGEVGGSMSFPRRYWVWRGVEYPAGYWHDVVHGVHG
jgi:hypothetical protein